MTPLQSNPIYTSVLRCKSKALCRPAWCSFVSSLTVCGVSKNSKLRIYKAVAILYRNGNGKIIHVPSVVFGRAGMCNIAKGVMAMRVVDSVAYCLERGVNEHVHAMAQLLIPLFRWARPLLTTCWKQLHWESWHSLKTFRGICRFVLFSTVYS